MAPIKILVADDNKLLLSMTRDVLEEAGFEVITVESGLEVFKQVLAQKPQMILLDIMMPGIDGIEVCSKLKKSPVTKDIVIVIHSGKKDPMLMDLCYEAGAEAFIIKSNEFEAIVSRVKEIAHDKLGVKV
jgi:formate hydrogenlyase transcriptional activator